MGPPDDDDLTDQQELAIQALSKSTGNLSDLMIAFPDPREAFICSPVALTVKQLAAMYQRRQPAGDPQALFDFMKTLRDRSDDERWIERRALFQAKRASARREALITAEAEVWAIVGLEFHVLRMRGLMRRWEVLSNYVMDALTDCEDGSGQFTAAIRDACKELNELERNLTEIMPNLGLTEKGQEMWTKRSGDRGAIIARIGDKLQTMHGADRAQGVYELLQGGAAGRDPGAANE